MYGTGGEFDVPLPDEVAAAPIESVVDTDSPFVSCTVIVCVPARAGAPVPVGVHAGWSIGAGSSRPASRASRPTVAVLHLQDCPAVSRSSCRR